MLAAPSREPSPPIRPDTVAHDMVQGCSVDAVKFFDDNYCYVIVHEHGEDSHGGVAIVDPGDAGERSTHHQSQCT